MPRKNGICFQDEHAAVFGGRFSLKDILVGIAGKDKGALSAPLLRQPRVQPLSGIGNALRLPEAQVYFRMILAEAQDALQHSVVITSVAETVRADEDRKIPRRKGMLLIRLSLSARGRNGQDEEQYNATSIQLYFDSWVLIASEYALTIS